MLHLFLCKFRYTAACIISFTIQKENSSGEKQSEFKESVEWDGLRSDTPTIYVLRIFSIKKFICLYSPKEFDSIESSRLSSVLPDGKFYGFGNSLPNSRLLTVGGGVKVIIPLTERPSFFEHERRESFVSNQWTIDNADAFSQKTLSRALAHLAMNFKGTRYL